MLSIHQRPFAPDDRSETGHWEGDLIVGRAQGSVIGTLVERQTRTIRLLHPAHRNRESGARWKTQHVDQIPVDSGPRSNRRRHPDVHHGAENARPAADE